MRSMTRSAATLLAALILVALVAPQVAADDAPGKAVFEAQKCGLCHGVAAAGIEAKTKSDKLKGPDLSGYVHEDPAWVMAYLRKEEKKDGVPHKRAIKASDEELQPLIDWLASLPAQE